MGAYALVQRKFIRVPSVTLPPRTYPVKGKKVRSTKKPAVGDKKRQRSRRQPVKIRQRIRSQPVHDTNGNAPGPSRRAVVNPVDDNAEEEEFPGFSQEDIDRVRNEIIQQDLNVNWDDIVNLQHMKYEMIEATMMPIWFPSYFTGIRTPSKGILLFGPPGTGKTMAAKAVATVGGYTFFSIKSSTIASPFQGVSETIARLIFEMARAKGPSVVFIDEVDALCSPRGALGESESSRKVLSEFLTQMDGINNSDTSRAVLVIGATNRPWDLDEAIIRRFETRLYVPLPNAEARLEMLEKYLAPYTLASDVVLMSVAGRLEGFSGDDMRIFSRNVSMMGMRQKTRGKSPAEIGALPPAELDSIITLNHFQQAEQNAKPSVNQDLIDRHEDWNDEFGSK